MPPFRRKSAARPSFLPVVFLLALPCAAHARGSFDHYRQITRSERAPSDTAVSLAGAQAVVAFSPNGGGTRLIVRAIDHARQQVLVQAYSFTSRPILRALVEAHGRGVDVEVILDHSDLRGRHAGASDMVSHGIPVWIDTRVRIAHNKVMILDGRNVLTGSFNFSWSAQHLNAENVLEIKDAPSLARAYLRDWRWRQSLSRKVKE